MLKFSACPGDTIAIDKVGILVINTGGWTQVTAKFNLAVEFIRKLVRNITTN
jgi:hypothetical protein